MTDYEMFSGSWLISPLVMFFFWVLLAKRRRGRVLYECCTSKNFRESPLDILNKRYARGEIDNGEYEKKKKTIVYELEKLDSWPSSKQ